MHAFTKNRLGLAVLLTALLFGSLSCQVFQEGGREHLPGAAVHKVGVIDVQAVFERSREGRRALDGLIVQFAEHRRKLTAEETSLQETAGLLDRERGILPTDQLRDRTERYLVRLEQYRLQVQAFNQDLARRHRDLVSDYLPKIMAAAKPIAERGGFTAVLHQGRAETAMIVFYRAPDVDLTDRVIEALDRDTRP